jgi:hypothetical protein
MLIEKQARFQRCLINSSFTLMIFILWTTYWAWCWVLSNFWGEGGALWGQVLTMKGEVPRALCFFSFFFLQNHPKTSHVTHHSWMMAYSFSHFVCNHLAIKCRHLPILIVEWSNSPPSQQQYIRVCWSVCYMGMFASITQRAFWFH